MAVCKKCGSIIEDGEELCEECKSHEEDNNLEGSENYQDQTIDPDLSSLFSLDDIDYFGEANEIDNLDDLGDSSELLDFDGEILDLGDAANQIDQEVLDQDSVDTDIMSAAGEYSNSTSDPPLVSDEDISSLLDQLDDSGNLSKEQDLSSTETDMGDEPSEREENNQTNDDTADISADDDLMSLLNMMEEAEQENKPDEAAKEKTETMDREEKQQNQDNMDDIFSLIDNMDGDQNTEEAAHDPVEISPDEDVFSLDDLMVDEEDESSAQEVADVGDIFSDTLGAVDSPKDLEEMENLEKLVNADTEKKKEKRGLFERLFGNIHDEKAKAAEEKRQAKEKEKAEKKEAKKKAKENKSAKAGDGDGEESEEGKEVTSAKKAKKEKKEKKPKEKKVKLKEVDEEAPAEVEEEGRINRVGASIVFVLGACLTVFVFLGTKTFTYGQSIEKATEYFGVKKYTKAYDEVKGLDIKKKDEEIYNKIVTVMYVNKQLNSFDHYFTLKLYPEALDSLLKGIERYDSYIADAVSLGVLSDLDYVREQIIDELNNTYGLTEKQAYDIINTKSRESYSKKVLNASVLS